MTQALTCGVTEKLLQHYLDGGLSAAERQSVESHVAACLHCRLYFLGLERTVLALEALPRLQAPAAILAGTMAAVRATQEQRSHNPWLPVATFVAAMVALVGTAMALVAASDALFNVLADVLDDPASFLDSLSDMAMSAEFPLVLATCLLLVAGTAVMTHLVRSEFRAHPV